MRSPGLFRADKPLRAGFRVANLGRAWARRGYSNCCASTISQARGTYRATRSRRIRTRSALWSMPATKSRITAGHTVPPRVPTREQEEAELVGATRRYEQSPENTRAV